MPGSGDYDRKKKDTVVCLTGCAVVLFFVVAGNFDYDRKKIKIQSSVWRVVLYVVSVFGSDGKLAVFFATGNFHYDRKKMIQSSVWRVRDQLRPEKKDTVVCLLGAWFWQLRPEKKDTVVCLAGARSITTFLSITN